LTKEELSNSEIEDAKSKLFFQELKTLLGANCTFINGINFNENEEATCIEIALLMRKDMVKRWVLCPLFSILTIFLFPIMLYWSKRMQADWLYSRVGDIHDATNLYIISRDKNEETVELRNLNATILPLLSQERDLHLKYSKNPFFLFEYRFLKYKYDLEQQLFSPIKFNCEQSFETLLEKYKNPESCYSED
jgi:hypothetical protein